MSHGFGGDDNGGCGFDWLWFINWGPTFYPSIEWITNLNQPIITNTGDNIVFNG